MREQIAQLDFPFSLDSQVTLCYVSKKESDQKIYAETQGVPAWLRLLCGVVEQGTTLKGSGSIPGVWVNPEGVGVNLEWVQVNPEGVRINPERLQ